MEAARLTYGRWNRNLSWEAPHSGKMRIKIGWIFFAHHKNFIMGGGGRIAPQYKNLKNPLFHHGSSQSELGGSGK